MNLKLKAYKIRYDFDRMSTKDNIIFGHWKFETGESKSALANIEDVTITILKNGNRVVADRGSVIHTFKPA